MKKVTIYEDAHREAKMEAARLGRTMPNAMSEFIFLGVEVSREKNKEAAEPKKPATSKRKPSRK